MFLTGTYEDEDMKKGPLFSRKFSFSKILLGSVSLKTWQVFFSLTEKNLQLSNFPLYGSLKSMKTWQQREAIYFTRTTDEKLFLICIVPSNLHPWAQGAGLFPKVTKGDGNSLNWTIQNKFNKPSFIKIGQKLEAICLNRNLMYSWAQVPKLVVFVL